MITIRQCRKDDWEIIKLLRLSALADAPYAFSETLEEAKQMLDSGWKEIAKRNSRGEESTYSLAFHDEEPIGIAGGFISQHDRKRAYMSALWVDPRFRGSAVARGLIRFLINWAADMGVGSLAATMPTDNIAAQNCLKETGFGCSELSGSENSSYKKWVIPIKKSVEPRNRKKKFNLPTNNTNKTKPVEQRDSPREKCLIAVNFAFGEKTFTENILNISRGGMFVSCPERIPVGCDIKFAFHAPEIGPMECMGKISWINHMGLGVKLQ